MSPDRALRIAGAVALLAGGALHCRLALDGYGTDDLISLFFVNAIGSALVGMWLVLDRSAFSLLAGVGISAVSLAALGLSRTGDGVVGFRGVGLDPGPDVALTLIAEAAAVLLLGAAAMRQRGELVSRVRRAV